MQCQVTAAAHALVLAFGMLAPMPALAAQILTGRIGQQIPAGLASNNNNRNGSEFEICHALQVTSAATRSCWRPATLAPVSAIDLLDCRTRNFNARNQKEHF